MNKKKIVFFTPSFNRTGSEMALFNLISHSVNDFDMTVISKINGELIYRLPPQVHFESLETYLNPEKKPSTVFDEIKNRINPPIVRSEETFLKSIHQKYSADFWYLNTIMLPGVLNFAKQHKIPVVLHVHELEQMFFHLSGAQLINMFEYPFLILACSTICAENIKSFGRKEKIEVCYPANLLESIKNSPERSQQIRQNYNISKTDFLWIMSGTIDTNKNPSLFIEVAEHLLKLNPHARFMWITGREDDDGYVTYCKNKAAALEKANKLIWITKPGSEYYNYLNSANGFILTSTREASPMVVVEALYLGKPVVSFNCGGVQEIVNEQSGIVIEDHNIDKLIQAMLLVMSKKFDFDPVLAKASAERFDVTVQAERWKQILMNALPLSS